MDGAAPHHGCAAVKSAKAIVEQGGRSVQYIDGGVRNAEDGSADLREHRLVPLSHGRRADTQFELAVRIEQKTRVLTWPNAAAGHEASNADAVIPALGISCRLPEPVPIDFPACPLERRMKITGIVDCFSLGIRHQL